MKNHPRRSVLYVPGDSEKMILRSASAASDTLILNLEDGVALSQKESARDHVVHALKHVDFGGREIVVRINNLDAATGRSDLTAVAPLGPDGICLPKTEKASDILAADRALLEIENGHGLPGRSIRLHAMIESAAGMLHAAEIAAASPRMASLVFGSADYANDVRCWPGEDRQELLLALQMLVTSARSAGIDAIDSPCFDIRNYDLLRREAVQARRLGFDGKSALHPEQCRILNEVFDVTAEEIAWAEQALAGLDEAENRGKALTTLDGKLIENPHRAAAERILSRRPPR
jgi:citrate lyase beta subunit